MAGTVFVATDSPAFLGEVRARWPAARVRYRADVMRHESNAAFAKGKGGGGGRRVSNDQKGEQVLQDARSAMWPHHVTSHH